MVTLASLPLFGIMLDYNVEDMAMLKIYIVVGGMLLTASIEGTACIRAIIGRCCRKPERRIAPRATMETQEGETELREEEKIARRKLFTVETIAEEQKDSERSDRLKIRRFFYKSSMRGI